MTPALLEIQQTKAAEMKKKRKKVESDNQPLSPEESNLLGWKRRYQDELSDYDRQICLEKIKEAQKDVDNFKLTGVSKPNKYICSCNTCIKKRKDDALKKIQLIEKLKNLD